MHACMYVCEVVVCGDGWDFIRGNYFVVLCRRGAKKWRKSWDYWSSFFPLFFFCGSLVAFVDGVLEDRGCLLVFGVVV